jgi:uncharacterized protein involved in exopolysaccharide biosynthesis
VRAAQTIVVVVVFGLAALFWVQFFGIGKRPVYRSSTLIQIAGDDTGILIAASSNTCYLKVDGLSYRETQMDLIRSGLMISKTRERLKMPAEIIASNLVRLVVVPRGNSAILSLSVDSYDPQFSADFANAWVEAYFDFKAEERMSAGQSTVVFLVMHANRIRDEIKKETEKLQESELMAKDLISSNNVLRQKEDLKNLRDISSGISLQLKRIDTAIELAPPVVRQIERAVPSTRRADDSIWP